MVFALQALISAIITLIAGVIDYKTGLIPDKLTLPSIALGAALLAFSPDLLITGVASALIVYAVGFIFYYFGQLGGGDVKLFTALAVLLPYSNSLNIPFVLLIILTASTLAVFVFSGFYGLKYALRVKDKNVNSKQYASLSALFVASSLYAWLMNSASLFSASAVILVYALLLISSFYLVLGKELSLKLFAKKLPVKGMDLGEVIVLEKLSGRERESLGLNSGKKVFDEKVLELAQKNKIKDLWVYYELPRFGSMIFLGTVIVLLNPDWPLMLLNT